MTQTGVRELPFYADNWDLIKDWLSGVLKADDEIVYRNVICAVVGEFTDDDGERYTELLVVDGSGVSFVQQTQAGNGFYRIEFKMM